MKKSIYLLVLGLLALASASCASAQMDRFSGYWKNLDPDTRGITTLEIDTSGADVAVRAWGKFYPSDIDWEYANSSYAYGPGVSSGLVSEVLAISAVWTTSFSETLMIVRPAEEDRLQADVYSRFTDRSGRTAYAQSYVFERGQKYQCYQDLQDPILELTGTEDAMMETDFTRYMINITNWDVYPAELFEAAPDLARCGLNNESSRTWVDIYNQEDICINRFCNLGTPEDLKEIWFAVKKGEAPPESVYIVMIDRRCDLSYVSNEVAISTPSGITTPTMPIATATKLNLPSDLRALVNF